MVSKPVLTRNINYTNPMRSYFISLRVCFSLKAIAFSFNSYSFHMNPNWSRSYSPQPEILMYLQEVADEYHITEHVELQKRVVKSMWDETKQKWTVDLDNGEVLSSAIYFHP